jgi:hypothetical protein
MSQNPQLTQHIKSVVASEISRQFAQVRDDVREEIRAEIRQTVRDVIREELNTTTEKLNTKISETCVKLQSMQSSGGMELTKRETALEERVMSKINKEYGGQIAKIVEYNAYQMQDTDGLINAYRQQVVVDNNKSNQKLLTGRGDTRHIISENVSLAFGYTDETF